MKKRVVILLLICSFVLCIALPFGSKTYADPFTAGQIASTAYAMMQGWGVSFTAGSASASGMNDFMTEQIQDYVNSKGGTIADVFAGKIAVDVAGKLVVGQQMYNSVVGFLGWLKDKYSLSASDFALTDGEYDGVFIPSTVEGDTFGSYTIRFHSNWPSGSYGYQGYYLYDGDRLIYQPLYQDNWRFEGTWSLNYSDGTLYCATPVVKYDTGEYVRTDRVRLTYVGTLNNSLSWSVPETWSMPTVLNPDKEWTGTIGGYSTPDTNLDQLLGNIDQAVADNNLVVDGEVIDIPVPPTPIPTIEPGDIDGYWNRQSEQLEGLGNDIGDISGHLDDIGDQIGDVTGAVEGVQQGIHTQTGVISGAMDQAAQDVVSAIGSQTAALDESLTATAEGIQDITEALTAPEIDARTFNLSELFPFCIPFDIYHLLQKFDGAPTAPHVQLPIVIPSIGFSYTLDLDFSAWDPVAAAMRTVELIVYALGLAWATSKAIKW